MIENTHKYIKKDNGAAPTAAGNSIGYGSALPLRGVKR